MQRLLQKPAIPMGTNGASLAFWISLDTWSSSYEERETSVSLGIVIEESSDNDKTSQAPNGFKKVFWWFLKLFIYLFIYFWLCWVFVSVQGLSPVAASGGHSSSRCAGLSPSRPLLLRSTGSRRAGSVAVAHGPSCSVACGIFLDQGSNPYPLHWQADSQPLRHQGSPRVLTTASPGKSLLPYSELYAFRAYSDYPMMSASPSSLLEMERLGSHLPFTEWGIS